MISISLSYIFNAAIMSDDPQPIIVKIWALKISQIGKSKGCRKLYLKEEYEGGYEQIILDNISFGSHNSA